MAGSKRETYTDLLIHEVVSYLTWVAANSCRSSEECDALYRAARLVGNNKKQLISRVLRQMDWHDALSKTTCSEASNGR